jgi:hypothetical protein
MFSEALRQAGVGSGKPPSGMDVGMDGEQAGGGDMPALQAANEIDPSMNFVAFGDDLTEGDEDGQEIDDPRIAQLIERNQALESRFEKMMEMLVKREGPIEPASLPKETPAVQEEDFFKGYDPSDLLEKFTTEPNQALAQTPIIKQLSSIIMNQNKVLQDLQTKFDEMDYFESENVQDLTDKQLHRKVMGMASSNPRQLLALAAKQVAAQEKEERQKAAAAAEGVKTTSKGGRSEQAGPRVSAQERAAMAAAQRIEGGFNIQNRLNEIVRWQQRGSSGR